MRVLLYDVRNEQYFQSLDCWTADPAQALDFKGTVHAVDLAFQKKLKDVAILLTFDDPGLNMHLPLSISG